MEQSNKLTIAAVLDAILDIVLIISSGYFIYLFALVLFPNFNYRSFPVMIACIAALMILRFNEKISSWTIEIVKFLGSLSFVMFFVSKYLASNSLMAEIFSENIAKIEPIFNLGAITLLLILIAGAALFKLFYIIAGIVADLLDKINLPNIALIVFLLLMIVPFVILKSDRVMDVLVSKNLEIAKYLIPFFGFSLLYLHANYFTGLIRSQLKTQ